DRERTRLVEMPLCENWIVAVRYIWSARRIAPEHHLGVLVRRATLGAYQVVVAVLLEDVRRLDPDRLLREVHSAVHDDGARSGELLRGDVDLLDPDRAVAVVERRADGRSVVHDVRLAVVVEEEGWVDAVDLAQPHRVRPRSRRILRGDEEVSAAIDQRG